MLNEGIFLMTVGMGVVFSFLTIMVISMQITAKIISVLNKYCPETVAVKSTIVTKNKKSDEEIALAIAAAKRFRK